MPGNACSGRGLLHRRSRGGTFVLPDASGLLWQGVRLRTAPSTQSVRDLQVERISPRWRVSPAAYVYRLHNLVQRNNGRVWAVMWPVAWGRTLKT